MNIDSSIGSESTQAQNFNDNAESSNSQPHFKNNSIQSSIEHSKSNVNNNQQSSQPKSSKKKKSHRRKKRAQRTKHGQPKRTKSIRPSERFINSIPLSRVSPKVSTQSKVYTIPRIFTIRTILGMEQLVSNNLEAYFSNSNLVSSIILPVNLKGYVFVETTDYYALRRALLSIPTTNQQIINNIISAEEFLHYLDPNFKVDRRTEITEGDIVIITEGKYKDQSGIVTQIKEKEKMVIIELIDEFFKIRVRVSRSAVKHIYKTS